MFWKYTRSTNQQTSVWNSEERTILLQLHVIKWKTCIDNKMKTIANFIGEQSSSGDGSRLFIKHVNVKIWILSQQPQQWQWQQQHKQKHIDTQRSFHRLALRCVSERKRHCKHRLNSWPPQMLVNTAQKLVIQHNWIWHTNTLAPVWFMFIARHYHTLEKNNQLPMYFLMCTQMLAFAPPIERFSFSCDNFEFLVLVNFQAKSKVKINRKHRLNCVCVRDWEFWTFVAEACGLVNL